MQQQHKMLRLKQVLELVPASRATIWRWARLGQFPQPIKLGQRTTAWRESDVQAWLASKGAA